MTFLVAALAGIFLGRLSAGWAAALLFDMNNGGLYSCPNCSQIVSRRDRWFSFRKIRCNCTQPPITWHRASAVTLGALFLLFTWLLIQQNCEAVTEVQPTTAAQLMRLPFHLSLIFLLWAATVTDLLDYVIPDEIIYLGIAVAVVGAFATGDLQMIHIWVNWDDAVDGLRGPYLPEWMKHHQHLHGLAWSMAGLICGAFTTWIIRASSHLILGYPALGFGDVTLMAMIGAYLGWQPALCVLAIAPLVGMVIGLLTRMITGRTFVAYGPYLACSAYIVMCSWRWLWADALTLRDIFSHWPSVVGLVGGSFVTLVILLTVLRFFRALPAGDLRR